MESASAFPNARPTCGSRRERRHRLLFFLNGKARFRNASTATAAPITATASAAAAAAAAASASASPASTSTSTATSTATASTTTAASSTSTTTTTTTCFGICLERYFARLDTRLLVLPVLFVILPAFLPFLILFRLFPASRSGYYKVCSR
jgi:hypothetical protein